MKSHEVSIYGTYVKVPNKPRNLRGAGLRFVLQRLRRAKLACRAAVQIHCAQNISEGEKNKRNQINNQSWEGHTQLAHVLWRTSGSYRLTSICHHSCPRAGIFPKGTTGSPSRPALLYRKHQHNKSYRGTWGLLSCWRFLDRTHRSCKKGQLVR